MYRFVALLWNGVRADDPAALRLAALARRQFADWRCVCNSSAITAFELSNRDGFRGRQLDSGSGVVLGQLFDKRMLPGTNAPATIDAERERRFASTRGRTLVSDFWGPYVAILLDRATTTTCIIRDCSGQVPCFRVRSGAVDIVFSDVMDILGLGLRFDINWRYLSAFLFFDDIRIRECGIKGVTALLAGDCLEITPTTERHFSLWDPNTIARLPQLDSYELARSELRHATENCIAAWGGIQQRVMLNLSGGLDSAIVLGCATQRAGGPAITCLNRYSLAVDEDERPFARLAAARANSKLVEVEWKTGGLQIDDRVLNAPKTVNPTLVSFMLLDTAPRNALAEQYDVDALWTGEGGDHLFLQAKMSLPAGDYVHDHGVSRGLLSIVRETANFTGEPFWSVLRGALRDGYCHGRWAPDLIHYGQMPFVRKEAVPADIDTYAAHPWTFGGADLPKGKQYQVRILADLVNRPIPAGHLERVSQYHPLISQPLMETSLRIPTYVLQRGGKHRALARDAFKDIVPNEIIARETKGATITHALDLIRLNKALLQDVLLDGRLVREGLLDRKALEPYICRGHPLRPMQLLPMLACAAAEIWVRNWENQALSIAA